MSIYILVFVRTITFLLTANAIYPHGTPNMLKIFLSLIISTTISSSLNIEYVFSINGNLHLIILVLNEIMTGFILGYMVNVCFSMINFAGSIISNQMGLSMVSMYNLNAKTESTIMSNFEYWIFIIVFFCINGHYELIRGLIKSFNTVPIGKVMFTNINLEYVINVFINYFEIGFRIAIPIVATLIIVELLMGIISRSVPGINLLIIGLPIKLLIGFIILLQLSPYIVNQFVDIITNISYVLDGKLSMIPIGIFLSKEEKTEKATDKKKKDVRKKGNVFKSKEVSIAITFIGIVLFTKLWSKDSINSLLGLINSSLSFSLEDINIVENNSTAIYTVIQFLKVFLPLSIVILILGVLSNLLQTGFMVSFESIKPKLSKINPINGIKNLFSLDSLGKLIKDLIVISIIAYIGYTFISDNYKILFGLTNVYTSSIILTYIYVLIKLFTKIAIALTFVALIDYIYNKNIYNKKIRMTKKEVKDEFKESEGDPLIKSKIRQIQRQMAFNKMAKDIPNASVIITNPTHISVAIKYKKSIDQVPIVVAKGEDYLAKKIKIIAKDNNIPIIENKDLARLLYKNVEVGKEIPTYMYEAVAKVLVSIYKIKY